MLILLTFGCFVRANTVTISVGNSAIGGYPGPYAHADVNLNGAGTVATITITGENHAGNIYLIGGNTAVALNSNGASTVGSFTGTNSRSGFTPGPFSDGGAANNVSQFGDFTNTVTSAGGFMNTSDVISFTLTKSSGTWSSAANVLSANSDGFAIAAHIFVFDGTYDRGGDPNGALNTGFAGAGPSVNPLAVPLPATAWMGGSLLSTLGVFGMIRRRRLQDA